MMVNEVLRIYGRARMTDRNDLVKRMRELHFDVHGKFVFHGGWDVELEKKLVDALRGGRYLDTNEYKNNPIYGRAMGITAVRSCSKYSCI